MELKDFFKQSQRIIETKDKKDYGNAEMATKIGVTEQTYGKYKRGEINPLIATAILNLLSNMDNENIVQMIGDWEKESRKKKIQ